MAMKKAVAKRPDGWPQRPSGDGSGTVRGRSDLTRISRALSEHLNAKREGIRGDYMNEDMQEEEFRMSHPIAELQRKVYGAQIDEPVDEYDASEMLNDYRKHRDTAVENRNYDPVYDRDSRTDIKDAYANRYTY